MILQGDCVQVLKQMAAESVQMCVTSPPYWGLRDYGVDGQLGLEETPEQFVESMVSVFREVRRVMKEDGTLWVNIGDSYASAAKNRNPEQATRRTGLRGGFATQEQSLHQKSKVVAGLKQKDLAGIPWMLAFALRADGWYLRQDIIWHKPNPMPESVTDRCTKSHEYIFLLSKSKTYYFNQEAIKEPAAYFRPNGQVKSPHGQSFRKSGNLERKQRPSSDSVDRGHQAGSVPWEGNTRQKRSVWTVATKPFSEAHFATYPPLLIQPCILAGSRPGDTVLDPFFGAGTTGLVAQNNERKYIGIELNPEYIEIARKRLSGSLFGFHVEQSI